MKKWWLLVIGLGVALRVVGLSQMPAGVIPEEALLEYRAGLLRTEGRDETGRKWPIVFSSFGGYQGPATSYLAMLGGTRWPMALVSIGGLIAFGVISKNVVAVAVLALSPTMIMLSRSVSEWNAMLNIGLIVATIIIWRVKKQRRKFYFGIMGLLVIAWLWLMRSQFNFADDISIINGINRFRQTGSRLFYNKSYYGLRLVENYFDNIKPQYWFVGGDKNSIYGQTNYGILLAGFLPAFLLGLQKILKEKKWWLVGLMLIGVLPSVVSYPSPNQERVVIATLAVAMICALGWRRWMAVLVAINLAWVVGDGIKNEARRIGAQRKTEIVELAKLVEREIDNYETIYVSDGYCPDVGVVLAAKLGWKTNLWGEGLKSKQWINQIDKIIIGQKDSWERGEGRILMITSNNDEMEMLEKYEVVDKKAAGGCWRSMDKLTNYKLWQKTTTECRPRKK